MANQFMSLALTIMVITLSLNTILTQNPTKYVNEEMKKKHERRIKEIEEKITRLNQRSREQAEQRKGQNDDQSELEETMRQQLQRLKKKLEHMRENLDKQMNNQTNQSNQTKNTEESRGRKNRTEHLVEDVKEKWNSFLLELFDKLRKIQNENLSMSQKIAEFKKVIEAKEKELLGELRGKEEDIMGTNTWRKGRRGQQNNQSRTLNSNEILMKLSKLSNGSLKDLISKMWYINIERSKNSNELAKCFTSYQKNFHHLMSNANSGTHRDSDSTADLINAYSECEESDKLLNFPVKMCFDNMIVNTGLMIEVFNDLKVRQRARVSYANDQELLKTFKEITKSSFQNIGSECMNMIVDKELSPCDEFLNKEFDTMADEIETLGRKIDNISIEHVKYYLKVIRKFWTNINIRNINLVCSIPYNTLNGILDDNDNPESP